MVVKIRTRRFFMLSINTASGIQEPFFLIDELKTKKFSIPYATSITRWHVWLLALFGRQ
jgi:hypothetical protein